MIGWVDGTAGASGDMLLGALVDAGVPLAVLQAAVDGLGVERIVLTAEPVRRASLGATKVDVVVDPALEVPARTWADVRRLLAEADLLPAVRRTAEQVFAALAAAEAAVHRMPVDEVHFHEVGALDALADVVGVCAGLHALGLDELHCGPLALGSGSTRGAHGPLPVPAPAVLALLAGRPVTGGGVPAEMTTPTGAALLVTLAGSWGPLPPMAVQRVGSGAGGRDPVEVANLLRLVVGTRSPAPAAAVLLETNVDDLDPRLWPGVLSALLAAGASDAWLTPILMKKGRPAHTLSVLSPAGRVPVLRRLVFTETSTIGLRESELTKHALERTESTVLVDGRPVRVKTAWLQGAVVNVNPEWEDVAAAARALGRPAKEILAEARHASGPPPEGDGPAGTG